MNEYFRASKAEPSLDDVKNIFNRSGPRDWLYDPETDTYTHRNNLLVFVSGNHSDTYTLRYGHMDVSPVTRKDLKQRLTPQVAAAAFI